MKRFHIILDHFKQSGFIWKQNILNCSLIFTNKINFASVLLQTFVKMQSQGADNNSSNII